MCTIGPSLTFYPIDGGLAQKLLVPAQEGRLPIHVKTFGLGECGGWCIDSSPNDILSKRPFELRKYKLLNRLSSNETQFNVLSLHIVKKLWAQTISFETFH